MIRVLVLIVLALTACSTRGQAVPVTTQVEVGDPVAGEPLFTAFQPSAGIACSTCHKVDSEQRLVGPGLLHIAERARTRSTTQTAADYIRTSIVDPSALVVDGYADIMPKNWGQIFSEAELNDLIAYLMTL